MLPRSFLSFFLLVLFFFSSSTWGLAGEQSHPCDTPSDYSDLIWHSDEPLDISIEFVNISDRVKYGDVQPVSSISPSCYIDFAHKIIGPFLIENQNGTLDRDWASLFIEKNGYLVGSTVFCWLFDGPVEQSKIIVRIYQKSRPDMQYSNTFTRFVNNHPFDSFEGYSMEPPSQRLCIR